jgi:hypothetical protein
MKLWEYVLSLDKAHDLTGRDAIIENSVRLAMSPIRRAGDPEITPNPDVWPPALTDRFAERVRALRLAVRVVACAKTRRPGIDHVRAEGIFRAYVERNRPFVPWRPQKLPRVKGRPRIKGLPRVRYIQAVDESEVRLLVNGRGPSHILIEGNVRSAERFWASVFGSLALLTDSSYCGCGRVLPPTPKTHRPSRRVRCPLCTLRKHRKGQSTQALRDRWREDKARQRAAKRDRFKPKDIVQKVETPVETIKNWVK